MCIPAPPIILRGQKAPAHDLKHAIYCKYFKSIAEAFQVLLGGVPIWMQARFCLLPPSTGPEMQLTFSLGHVGVCRIRKFCDDYDSPVKLKTILLKGICEFH